MIEKCLNHTSGSFRGVIAVYQRHDFAAEKRHALQTWATLLSGSSLASHQRPSCRCADAGGDPEAGQKGKAPRTVAAMVIWVMLTEARNSSW